MSTIRRRQTPSRKQIAFNVIPHIDVFMEDGFTKEEWKMTAETKKIIDLENQTDRHMRARAGFCRPFGSGECGTGASLKRR